MPSKNNIHSFLRHWVKPMAFLLVYYFILPVSGGSNPQNKITSNNLNAIDEAILPDHLNEILLETAIVYYTNIERTNHHLKALTVSSILQKSARGHSLEMASLYYFSHQSPVVYNQKLTDRLKNAGFNISNTTVGENIGVDYFLNIANIPFYTTTKEGYTRYINANTGQPIMNQTYREFAKHMVQNWMKSPGHRKNILNPQYENIGCGIGAGIYQGMKAIYATQNFSGTLRPPYTIFGNE